MPEPPPPDNADTTIVDGIIREIIDKIETYQLCPGMRLPSIRRFAAEKGVAPSTVVEAYDRLVALGYLAPKKNIGFFVKGPRDRKPSTAVAPAPYGPDSIDHLWSTRRSLDTPSPALEPGSGRLPVSWLDDGMVRKALRFLARSARAQLLDYGHRLGFAPLRDQLCLLLRGRGLDADPGQIVLTGGATAAADLVYRLMLQPGDHVFVDTPCYPKFLANLTRHPVHIIGIPFTKTGPDLDAFRTQAERHRPKLYVTCAGPHNPTGTRVPPAVQHQIVRCAEEYDIHILEDDVFFDIEENPGPRLAALDGLNRVIHIGSFSKTLSAAVRCGHITARRDLAERLADLKLAVSFGHDDVAAQIIHHLLVEGHYRKHVEQITTRLQIMRPKTLNMLRTYGFTPWVEPDAGLFVWVRTPPPHNAASLAQQAQAAGIMLAPGAMFTAAPDGLDPYLRFNIAQSLHKRVDDFLSSCR